MQQEKNINRLRDACQMVLELASGNFAYRVDTTDQDDILEVILILLNGLAEKSQISSFHFGYVNPHESYQYITQEVILLHSDDTVINHTSTLLNFLACETPPIIGTSFSSLLDKESQSIWQLTKEKLLLNESTISFQKLSFSTSTGLYAETYCSITRLNQEDLFLISFFTPKAGPTYPLTEETNDNYQGQQQNNSDMELIQKVYDFVLHHNEGPFPTIKEISRCFSTNEFKLKTGFQHYFKTSIYQLYNDQRLKRAYLLIRYTKKALKNIAFTVGFSTYSNFSRAFKIKFGCGPGEIPRRNIR